MKNKQNGFKFEDIDFEDKTKRTENEKHYKLKDGSFVAAIYNSPVHYWDEKDNCYHTADNTLVESDNAFSNTKGSFKAHFAKIPKNETSIMKLEKEDRCIEWEYLSARKRKFDKAKIKQHIDDSPSLLPKLNSVGHIRYPEICKNTDIEYEVTPTGIKENIIIKAKKRSYKFRFKLKVTGYNVQECNGELHFTPVNTNAEEKSEFKIPKLFMTDRNGNLCNDVKLGFEKISDVEYLVTVIPDSNWINNEHRVFPIMVDPSISTITNKTCISSRTYSSNGFVSASTDNYRQFGFDSTGEEYRTYFMVDSYNINLPDYAEITQATFNVISQDSSAKMFDIYNLYNKWEDEYLSWDMLPSEHRQIASYSYLGTDIDITDEFKKWYEGTAPNNGFVIKGTNCCDECQRLHTIYSENHYNYSPYLAISYYIPENKTYDDYRHNQEYYSIDLGGGRAAAVNLNTGNLELNIPIIDSEQSFTPFPISLIYDKSMEYYDTWKLSPEQKLLKAKRNDQGIKKIYVDESGKAHSMILKSALNDDDYDTVVESTGMLIQHGLFSDSLIFDDATGNYDGDRLWFEYGNAKQLNFIDERGVYYYNYDIDGKLLSVKINEHTNYNKTIANISYINDRYSTVTDSNGRMTIINYSGSNLNVIERWNGDRTVFKYTNGRISEITTEAGIRHIFAYDSNNRVIGITTKNTFSIINKNGAYSETNNNVKTIENITIEYLGERTTAIYGKNKIKTVHLFDNKGRSVTSYKDYSLVLDETGTNESYPHIGSLTQTPCAGHTFEDGGAKLMGGYKEPDNMHSCSATLNSKRHNFLDDTNFGTVTTDFSAYQNSSDTTRNWITPNSNNTRDTSAPRHNPNKVSMCIQGSSGTTGISKIVHPRYTTSDSAYDEYYYSNIMLVSAWFKLSDIITASDSTFDLIAEAFYADCENNETESSPLAYTVNLDKKITSWQYAAVALPIKRSDVLINDSGDRLFKNYTLSKINFKFDCTGSNQTCIINDPRMVALRGNSNDLLLIENGEIKTVNYDGILKKHTVANCTSNLITSVTTITDNNGYSFTEISKSKRKIWNHEFSVAGAGSPAYISKTDYNGITTSEYYGYDSNKPEHIVAGIKNNTTADETVYENLDTVFSRHIVKSNNIHVQDVHNTLHTEHLLKSTENGDNIKTEYDYADNTKLLTEVKDGEDNITTYEYLDNGKLYKIISGNEYNRFNYRNGFVTEVNNGMSVEFEYDGFGREKRVAIAGNNILSKVFTDKSDGSAEVTVTYANNNIVKIYLDPIGNPIKKEINGTLVTSLAYDVFGKITEITDYKKNTITIYEYNHDGNVTSVSEKDINSTTDATPYVTYTYDLADPKRIEKIEYAEQAAIDGIPEYTFEYRKVSAQNSSGDTAQAIAPSNDMASINIGGVFSNSVSKDSLLRVHGTVLRDIENSRGIRYTNFGYTARNQEGVATNHEKEKVNYINYDTDKYIEYTYDNNGNITGIDSYFEDTIEPPIVTYATTGYIQYTNNTIDYIKYIYDCHNRVEKEINYRLNMVTTYEYDTYGNITSKKVYNYDRDGNLGTLDKSFSFVYNTSRKDLLTSLTYNDGTSETFSYDGLGNPTVYRGKILQWSNVNQLTNYNGNTFTYDGTGKRISKNGTTYFYAGDKLIKESRPNNVTISYLYGLDGIIGFKYGENYYFYQKNLQGDVIEIIARNGISVANYSYDAFGNHKVYNTDWTENTSSDFIGNINPIRYRGYYYDTETSLYFVQGRYYDAEIGRFISLADTSDLYQKSITGLNLYSYAFNTPIGIAYSSSIVGVMVSFDKNLESIGYNAAISEKYLIQTLYNSISNILGFSANTGKETTMFFFYHFLYQTETGTGYSKSFNNGKPVNLYITFPEKWWKFWEISFGIDVNINGYGIGIGRGPETSLTFHLGKKSLDIYYNSLGRLGIKSVTEGLNGEFIYSKFELNGPEILATVAIIYYAWPFLKNLLKGWVPKPKVVPYY